MAFPTLGTAVASATDAASDGSGNYDLTNVTVPSGYQTLLVMVSVPRGPTFNVTSATWDQGGAGEAMTACGTFRTGASWGGARIFLLNAPTAGNNKTVRVVSTSASDQIAVLAVPIQEAVAQIDYNSQQFTQSGTGAFSNSITGIACTAGDALFAIRSDDGGSSSETVSFTSGTQLGQQGTGSGDSYSTEGYQVAAGSSETITFAGNATAAFGSSVQVYVVLRSTVGPTINTHPSDAYVERGQVASFTVSATTSGGSLSYQWQSNEGGSFADISDNGDYTGTTTTTLTVLARQVKQGVQFRCNVTDSNGTNPSNAATLRIFAQLPFRFQDTVSVRKLRAFDTFDLSAWANVSVPRWMADEIAPVSGAGSHATSGALNADAATIAGTADHRTLHPTSGALAASAATIAGTAAHHHAATGALAGQAATIAGTATHLTLHATSAALAAQAAAIAGTAAHSTVASHATSGALNADAATITGAAAHEHATTGALASSAAGISGSAAHTAPGAHDASGALQAGDAQISGAALHQSNIVAPLVTPGFRPFARQIRGETEAERLERWMRDGLIPRPVEVTPVVVPDLRPFERAKQAAIFEANKAKAEARLAQATRFDAIARQYQVEIDQATAELKEELRKRVVRDLMSQLETLKAEAAEQAEAIRRQIEEEDVIYVASVLLSL